MTYTNHQGTKPQHFITLTKSGKSSIPQVKHKQLKVSSAGKLDSTCGPEGDGDGRSPERKTSHHRQILGCDNCELSFGHCCLLTRATVYAEDLSSPEVFQTTLCSFHPYACVSRLPQTQAEAEADRQADSIFTPSWMQQHLFLHHQSLKSGRFWMPHLYIKILMLNA